MQLQQIMKVTKYRIDSIKLNAMYDWKYRDSFKHLEIPEGNFEYYYYCRFIS